MPIAQQGASSRQALVTGGTGLIGRRIVSLLVERGWRVRVLTRTNTIPPATRVQFLIGDIRRAESVAAAAAGCQAIFHCATEKHDPGQMSAVNIDGTRHVVEAARATNVEFFCHLSTVGVIAPTSVAWVTEASPCGSLDAYETTKLTAEQVAAVGLPDGQTMVLRPTHVFAEDNRDWSGCR